MVAGGCSGGSGSDSSSAAFTGTAPPQQHVTIAPPGSVLKLGDVSVKIMRFEWQKHVAAVVKLPGTRIYAVVRLRVTNTGDTPGTAVPTQFWLLDSARHEFLALPKAQVPDPLIPQPLTGRTVAPGASIAGSLVFGTPGRFDSGSVLVYQFKDARAIAKATSVGLARFTTAK